jgi:signal transduction histidine kinase
MVVAISVVYILLSVFFRNQRQNIGSEQLGVTTAAITDVFHQKNYYLMPDEAYFIKLENAFYFLDREFSRLKDKELLISIQNIKINIQNGIRSNSAIHSVYMMLEDQNAPYVLVNGIVSTKTGLIDRDWMDVCLEMDEVSDVMWRNLPLSHSGNIPVISFFYKESSKDWRSDRRLNGYIVVNYYLEAFESLVRSHLQTGESAVLYNTVHGDSLTIVRDRYAYDEAVIERLKNNYLIDAKQKDIPIYDDSSAMLIMVTDIDKTPVEILLVKEDVQVNRLINNIRLSVVGMAAIIFIVLFVFYLRDKNLRYQIDINELNETILSENMLRLELETLYGYAQINSHFLMNTLDFIYWGSINSHGCQAKETQMVEKLCNILKYSLDASDADAPLAEEINYAKEYLEIQSLRRPGTFDVRWDISEELMDFEVSKLIIQPLIENSIQHGLGGLETGKLMIHISAISRGGDILIIVEDNGPGISEETMAALEQLFADGRPVYLRHIGLANVNRRLKLKHGDGYGVRLSKSQLGGLKVSLVLKAQKFLK